MALFRLLIIIEFRAIINSSKQHYEQNPFKQNKGATGLHVKPKTGRFRNNCLKKKLAIFILCTLTEMHSLFPLCCSVLPLNCMVNKSEELTSSVRARDCLCAVQCLPGLTSPLRTSAQQSVGQVSGCSPLLSETLPFACPPTGG